MAARRARITITEKEAVSQHYADQIKANPAIGRAVTVTLPKYIPRTPTVKQTTAMLLPHLEVLYGGAASGGKTEWLLMEGLRYVDRPDYHGLLFQRTYKQLQLPNSLLDRALQWLQNTDAKFDAFNKRFRFPSGATLTFGYLAHDSDKTRYDGPEFTFIGWDELTQFTEEQYQYLFGRMRRAKNSTLPLRVRAATNPGGLGHAWVKRRFIQNPTAQRIFVPAFRTDNPYVDGEQYKLALANLPPLLRMQRDEGNWDAENANAVFKRAWFEKTVPEKPSYGVRWCRFWDLAASGADGDYLVGALVGINDDTGTVYIGDIIREQRQAAEVEDVLRATAEADTSDVMIRIEQEPGSSGKLVVASYVAKFQGFDIKGVPAAGSGSKVTRYKPLAAQAMAGNVRLVEAPWNNDFMDEIMSVPTSSHDDQADAVSSAYLELVTSAPEDYEVWGA